MMQVTGLVAGYSADVDILHGIDMVVKEGEIVTILGPNGCGKSTLLKTIAGFLRPKKGTIKLADDYVQDIPTHRKVVECGIGFVPQTDNVFSTLSVRENMLLGGRTLPKAKQDERMETLVEEYPVLRKKLNDKAGSLSGGERQILSLARVLMPQPQLLLLDEPSAGLSPKMLTEVFDAIRYVRDRVGLSVLMVEQNALEALRISDRAYVLLLGSVVMEGNANELRHNPEMKELYLGGR